MPKGQTRSKYDIKFAAAFRDTVLKKYGRHDFIADALAGVTVGIIAIPLAMALAIASGVPPQYGLYTAVVGGLIIALCGGSRFSISGPTAAFVVLLYPVAHTFGIGGLLVATFLSGLILIGLGLSRLGRLLQFVPNSVVHGFTAGIGVVIAILQIRDFFGLKITELPESVPAKLVVLVQWFHTIDGWSVVVASATLAILVLWPRLKTRVPGHLIAVVCGTVLAAGINHWVPSAHIETIGSRFTYELNGVVGFGIPPVLPSLQWPWNYPGMDGQPLGWSFDMVRQLLGPALAIAALGAIESLLCAVVLDGMTRTRHHPNAELIGQGIGNVVAPFFGGFTATAAIARSAANVRAGAVSPVSAMIHALTVLLAIVLLADAFAWLPMPSMAAMLLMVAWNMSEPPHVIKLLKRAPREDKAVLLVCFVLTVMVDMVMAIGVGIVTASLLFMRNLADQSETTVMEKSNLRLRYRVPEGVVIYKFRGPLFFAAAERAVGSLSFQEKTRTVVFYMDQVPVIDVSGAIALVGVVEELLAKDVRVVIADLADTPRHVLVRCGLEPSLSRVWFAPSLNEAIARLVAEDDRCQESKDESA